MIDRKESPLLSTKSPLNTPKSIDRTQTLRNQSLWDGPPTELSMPVDTEDAFERPAHPCLGTEFWYRDDGESPTSMGPADGGTSEYGPTAAKPADMAGSEPGNRATDTPEWLAFVKTSQRAPLLLSQRYR
jgi:hypothetical protein